MVQKIDLHDFALKLRKNQTSAENAVWALLRNGQMGYKFRRQHPIDKYVLDFVCLVKKLVVEIDGGQHTVQKDQQRTAHIKGQGFTILRFWNNDVIENIEAVYQSIYDALHPPLTRASRDLSHKGRG